MTGNKIAVWMKLCIGLAVASAMVARPGIAQEGYPAIPDEYRRRVIWEDEGALFYSPVDAGTVDAVSLYLVNGRERIEAFFGQPFRERFTVRLYPDRAAFTGFFKDAWGVPSTECWMVAAAVAKTLLMLSPRVWKEEACEHDPDNAVHVQDIVTHELVHVYHGQHNPTGDFEGLEPIGWYLEGLAIYVAGQLERDRLADPAEAIETGAAPSRLADAWSGKYRYGVSGSMVQYIDVTYGREMTTRLLAATSQEEILSALDTSEEEFLAAWREFVAGSGD